MPQVAVWDHRVCLPLFWVVKGIVLDFAGLSSNDGLKVSKHARENVYRVLGMLANNTNTLHVTKEYDDPTSGEAMDTDEFVFLLGILEMLSF